MRAHAIPMLTAAVLSLGFAAPSRADDGKSVETKKTHRVLLRERWKAGDIVTRSAKETMSRNVESIQGDEPARKSPARERQTSYVVVTKCLEADAEGYSTRFLLYLTAWSIEAGPEKDSSLAGVQIEVSGRGATRAWKIVSPDANLSAAAKNWIELYYGSKASGEATYGDLEPKQEVPVGGTWEGDGLAIAKRLAERGVAVDVEKSKALCTLVGVDGPTAHIQIKMIFPTKELVMPNGQSLPWKEGGALELSLDVTRPLAAGEFDAKVHREQKLAGIAKGDDVTLTWEDVGSQEIEIRSGGKMPEPPVAPPVAPTAVPKDGEKKDPAMDESPMGDGK